ncbi:PFL2/glycerol dehydratase family glycyl radical enzyme [Firmicutes bacterium M10-2]|nr:PFL2/glycerol dehydratase family glycyl radical enzyme [Firmicutes bacterium M10-2]
MNSFLRFEPQNTEIDLSRIERLRDKMSHRQASICSQRAMLYTESFQNTEEEPYILRKAKAFAYTLEKMSIYIEPDCLIFGNQASRNFAAPVFPEFSIDWVIDELDGTNGSIAFEKRNGDVFLCDEKTKAALRTIQSYWHGQTHEDEVKSSLTREIVLAQKQGTLHLGGISMSGDGHIVPDYAMLMKRGFRSLINEAKQRKELPETTEKQKNYYDAVIISLEGALFFFKRYASLLDRMAKNEKDLKRKEELETMASMAATMLEQPVRSFWEGCEVAYMIHMLQMIESNGHSFCYGRFDQYMLELYEQDLSKGLTKEKALEIITHMFLLNSSNNKVRPYGHTKFSQGYPLYSNLVVGGYRPDGMDGTNDLSYLCIEAMHLTSLAEPNFSLRYNGDTPSDLLDLASRLIRTGCGMPSLFNDDVAIRGLVDLGIPLKDARNYCPIGCVETGVPGKYGHRATGMTYVNWGKLLEIVLYHGTDPKTGIRLLDLKEKYESYEDVWQAWKETLKFYSDMAVEADAICDRALAYYDADPFASCLIDNSMEQGKTLKEGGCRYDVVSQSNIGPSVVGNSLMVIKKLVFDEKRISWNELMDALADNWQSDTSRHIHKMVLKVAKFGNDEDEVDLIVKDVFDSYLELLPRYKTLRYGQGPDISCYTMSTSNITSYVPNGLDVGATPDGRYAYEPLNEGCSPTQGTDIHGPTALINSVGKLPNYKVAAGQLLNMRFSPDALQGEEGLSRFVSFLKVSQKKGIYHNQFNVLSKEQLKEAQADPKAHQDLIVRVAGYCAQFVSLMPEAQEAIIARTENRWN